MPSRKRRTTTTKKAMAEAEMPASEAQEESSRPPVTQVVEVVDEGGETSAEEVVQSAGTTEEIPAEAEEKIEAMEENIPEIPERKKEMVDELYAQDRGGPSVMPEISMHKRNRAKPIVIWAVITLVVALVSGAILFMGTKPNALTTMLAGPTPTPTATPTPVATPTPEEIDKSAISIQVLNGGGTPGAAGKMKALLEEKGYTVSDTGNTDEYTYDTTEIHVKASASAALAHLEADLKEDYVLGTTAADLADDSDYDAQVIVGKE